MIRLAWRQFRVQAAIGIAGLVIVAIVALITGPPLAHLYNTTVATCKAKGDCQTATATFLATDSLLKNGLDVLLFVLPALIGIFWGAPLVARELETGTFRLAWTQSVPRARWLVVKLAVIGLSSIAVAGLLSLIVTWWFRPIDRVNANQFVATVFEARNIAPIGYAAFAFALGVTAGALIRRTVPAMAATIVGLIAARLAFTHWIRPHLLPAAHAATPLTSASNIGFQGDPSGALTFIATNPHTPNAWTPSCRIVDEARGGHRQPRPSTHSCKRCARRSAPRRRRAERTALLRRRHFKTASHSYPPNSTSRSPTNPPVTTGPSKSARDGNLPRRRPRPCRNLLLVGPPPRSLTRPRITRPRTQRQRARRPPRQSQALRDGPAGLLRAGRLPDRGAGAGEKDSGESLSSSRSGKSRTAAPPGPEG